MKYVTYFENPYALFSVRTHNAIHGENDGSRLCVKNYEVCWRMQRSIDQ